VFGVQDSYSVLDLSRTETWLPQRGPQVYLYSFNNLFWQTQVLTHHLSEELRTVQILTSIGYLRILSKHRRSCGTSYIRKLKTPGTQRLSIQVHSRLQVILPNQIISAHRTLFLNITWHRTEAHSGTRSFHHQLHLGYQLTSQVITLRFKSSPTSADSFYYSSEDTKALQLCGVHCTIVYTLATFLTLLRFIVTW